VEGNTTDTFLHYNLEKPRLAADLWKRSWVDKASGVGHNLEVLTFQQFVGLDHGQ